MIPERLIFLALEHQKIDIADNLSGQKEPSLRRDGTETTLGLGYSWDLVAGGVVSVDLSHIWLNRDGAGNKGCAYLAEFKHVTGVGRFLVLPLLARRMPIAIFLTVKLCSRGQELATHFERFLLRI